MTSWTLRLIAAGAMLAAAAGAWLLRSTSFFQRRRAADVIVWWSRFETMVTVVLCVAAATAWLAPAGRFGDWLKAAPFVWFMIGTGWIELGWIYLSKGEPDETGRTDK